MDVTSAAEVVSERADKSVAMKLVTIPQAGHNLFLDNPRAFIHQLMGSLMQPTAQWKREEATDFAGTVAGGVSASGSGVVAPPAPSRATVTSGASPVLTAAS